MDRPEPESREDPDDGERGLPFDEEDGLTTTSNDTGLTVSIMNKKLLAMTNTKAMAKLDWVALLLSAYVVGLSVSGEIKECVSCSHGICTNEHLSMTLSFGLRYFAALCFASIRHWRMLSS